MSWAILQNNLNSADVVYLPLNWCDFSKIKRFLTRKYLSIISFKLFSIIGLVLIPFFAQTVSASNDILSWNASAEAGLVYDSNVSIDEVDVHSSKGDGAIGGSASVGALAQWVDEGIELSADVSVFDTHYVQYDAFNTNTVMLSSTLAYDLSNYDLGLDYFYAVNKLDGDKFLSLSTIQPNVGGFIGRALYMRLGLGFTDKTFYQSEGRNADQYALNGNAYYFLRSTERYLAVSYRYSVENSSDKTFVYKGNHIKLMWNEKTSILGYKAKWKLGFSYGDQSYDNAPEEEESAQSDTSYSVFAEVKMDINTQTYWNLSYEYFDNNSNFRDQTYTQHIINASIGAEF